MGHTANSTNISISTAPHSFCGIHHVCQTNVLALETKCKIGAWCRRNAQNVQECVGTFLRLTFLKRCHWKFACTVGESIKSCQFWIFIFRRCVNYKSCVQPCLRHAFVQQILLLQLYWIAIWWGYLVFLETQSWTKVVCVCKSLCFHCTVCAHFITILMFFIVFGRRKHHLDIFF